MSMQAHGVYNYNHADAPKRLEVNIAYLGSSLSEASLFLRGPSTLPIPPVPSVFTISAGMCYCCC